MLRLVNPSKLPPRTPNSSTVLVLGESIELIEKVCTAFAEERNNIILVGENKELEKVRHDTERLHKIKVSWHPIDWQDSASAQEVLKNLKSLQNVVDFVYSDNPDKN